MCQVINLENTDVNLSLTIVTFCSYSNDCDPNSPSADSNAVCCLHETFCGDMLLFKMALWWAIDEKDICRAHCDVDVVEKENNKHSKNVTFLLMEKNPVIN